MAVTPTGPIGAPLEALKTLLCDLEAAQTLVGVEEEDLGTPEAAAAVAAHVYFAVFNESAMTPEEQIAARPVFVLWVADAGEQQRVASPNTWSASGALTVAISTVPGEDLGEADAYVQAANEHGGVIAELLTKSGTDGYLNVTRVQRKAGPQRPDERDRTAGHIDNLQTLFELAWADE